MNWFQSNGAANYCLYRVGVEQTPVLVLDDFCLAPEQLVAAAGDGDGFAADSRNFYPGLRKVIECDYAKQLCAVYLPLLQRVYQLAADIELTPLLSAYALATTPSHKLTPIQMVPHFDSTEPQQFALVHYLCQEKHGGTAFYRHKQTGYERISQQRLAHYGTLLKQQAMAAQLHKNPCYINDDNEMFSQIFAVAARFNRAVIYPSNLLHSGCIDPVQSLSCSPQSGRLTVSTFIRAS